MNETDNQIEHLRIYIQKLEQKLAMSEGERKRLFRELTVAAEEADRFRGAFESIRDIHLLR